MTIEGSCAGQDAARRFGGRLRALEPLIGTLVTVPNAGLAELTAGPVDFVWIDLEHGPLGVGDVRTYARVLDTAVGALRRELAGVRA